MNKETSIEVELSKVQRFKDLGKRYGFDIVQDGESYRLCAMNTDQEWTRWISYYPIKDEVSFFGNTDHLNIWLCDTRKDFTPEKCLQFVNELNEIFELTGEAKFTVKELIDPEDWQELAGIRDAYEDSRYIPKDELYRINKFLNKIETMVDSLKESVLAAENIQEKWNVIDNFMIDIGKLQINEDTMLKDPEYQIKEATLLSVKEYEKYQRLIPVLKDLWWLRTPGNDQYSAAGVDTGGNVNEYGYFVDSGFSAVRPALHIQIVNPGTFKPGDKVEIELSDKKWTVLDVFDDGLYILSDGHIGFHSFDSKSNVWETSELKDWLGKQFSIQKNVTLDTLIESAEKEQHRKTIKNCVTKNTENLER